MKNAFSKIALGLSILSLAIVSINTFILSDDGNQYSEEIKENQELIQEEVAKLIEMDNSIWEALTLDAKQGCPNQVFVELLLEKSSYYDEQLENLLDLNEIIAKYVGLTE